MGIVKTVLTELTCNCSRVQYADGVLLLVEAAISPKHTSEIVQQLDALRSSSNTKKKQRYYDLADRFEQLAAYGKLEQPLEMRPLEGELWEIKTSEDRVPFYRVDPSMTNQNRMAVRLTHQFAKATGKTPWGTTPAKHINRGRWIIEGDKAHGKRTSEA